MFKSALPYITDFSAHLLFFNDHIQTVHAHQGEFHAHAEVIKAVKDEHSEKNTNNNSKKDNSGNEHIIMDVYKFSAIEVSTNCFSALSIPAISSLVDCYLPPPKA